MMALLSIRERERERGTEPFLPHSHPSSSLPLPSLIMTPLSLATIEESEKKIDFGGWDDFPKQQLQQQL